MAQLVEALVRNCRFVAAIRMHAHGMTLDEATRLFVDNALYEETPARAEAERGAFDPGLLLLHARQVADPAAAGGLPLGRRRMRSTCRSFHDGLLSRGAPPVELMRGVLLPS